MSKNFAAANVVGKQLKEYKWDDFILFPVRRASLAWLISFDDVKVYGGNRRCKPSLSHFEDGKEMY